MRGRSPVLSRSDPGAAALVPGALLLAAMLLLAALLLLTLLPGTPPGAAHRGAGAGPLITRSPHTTPCDAPDVSCSPNWSGYVASDSRFTDVRGSWVQPRVSCPRTGIRKVAFWVGIDGAGSSTVEQVGTQTECDHGFPVSFAWTEMYPATEVPFWGLPDVGLVLPGDLLSAEVRVTGTTDDTSCVVRVLVIGRMHRWVRECTTVPVTHFLLSIADSGHLVPVLSPWGLSWIRVAAWHYSKSTDLADAQLSSAEWIAEAPMDPVCGRGPAICPMGNFAPVAFSGARATGGRSTGPITAFSEVRTVKTGINSSVVEAEPSGLSSGGTAFSVSRVRGSPDS